MKKKKSLIKRIMEEVEEAPDWTVGMAGFILTFAILAILSHLGII